MRKISVFLLTAIFFICTAGLASAMSFTWSENGHEYQVIEFDGISWYDAETKAMALGDGWHLATITSAAEQNFINAQIETPSTRTQYWIGGYQDVPNSGVAEGWNWVTGEEWNWTNWDSPPQPDDWQGDQIFLALDSNSGQWKWDDNYNTLQFTKGFIAEKSAPVPEPATMLLLGTGLVGLAGVKRKLKKK
jgi:hypothetical protein